MKQIPIALMGYHEEMAGSKKILRKKEAGEEKLHFVAGYDPRVSLEQFMELFEYLIYHRWEVFMKSTPRKNVKHFSHYCKLADPEGYEFGSFGASARGAFCGAAKKAAEWHTEHFN